MPPKDSYDPNEIDKKIREMMKQNGFVSISWEQAEEWFGIERPKGFQYYMHIKPWDVKVLYHELSEAETNFYINNSKHVKELALSKMTGRFEINPN
jgi:hypothetical protein